MKKYYFYVSAVVSMLNNIDAMIIPHNEEHENASTSVLDGKSTADEPSKPEQPQKASLHEQQNEADCSVGVSTQDAAGSTTDSCDSTLAATPTQPQQDSKLSAWAIDLWNDDKLPEEQKHELEMQGLNLRRVYVLKGKAIKNLWNMPFWKYADYIVIGDEVEEIFLENKSYYDDDETYLSSRVCCGPNSKLRHIGYINETMSRSYFNGQFDIPPSVTKVSAAMILSYRPRGMIFFHPECRNIEFIRSWPQNFDSLLYIGVPGLTYLNNNTLENLYKSIPELRMSAPARFYDECRAVIAADMARACMNIDYSQHVEKYRTWGSAAVLQQKGILPPTIEKVLADHKLALSETYVMRGKSLFVDDISCEILKYPVIYIDSDVEWIGDKCFEGLDNLRTIIFGPNSQVNSINEGAFSSCESLEKVIFVSYPVDYSEWLEEECTNAGIKRDKLEIETCETITEEEEEEEEEDASDISKSAVREPAKAYLLKDLYAAIWCKKHPNFRISLEPISNSVGEYGDIVEIIGKLEEIRVTKEIRDEEIRSTLEEIKNKLKEIIDKETSDKENIRDKLEKISRADEQCTKSYEKHTLEGKITLKNDIVSTKEEIICKLKEIVCNIEKIKGAQAIIDTIKIIIDELAAIRDHQKANELQQREIERKVRAFRYKWPHGIHKFMKMNSEQQNSIREFTQMSKKQQEDIKAVLRQQRGFFGEGVEYRWERSIESYLKMMPEDREKKLPEMRPVEQKYIKFLEGSPDLQKREQDYFQLSTEFRQHIHAPVLDGWIWAVPAFLQMDPDQQKNIADFSQLPDARMEDIIGFFSMHPKQQKSIVDFIQQIDNDEIEQLFLYYSDYYRDRNFYCASHYDPNYTYVLSGEHISERAFGCRGCFLKLIFAPNVKYISAEFCRFAKEIYFMKGSQFAGFVKSNVGFKIGGSHDSSTKFADGCKLPELKCISLANCNELTVLPTRMFAECKALEFVSIPDTVEEIEKECFYRCSQLKIIMFGLDSRLTKIGYHYYSFAYCIAPPRFFQGLEDSYIPWEKIFTPWQRVPLPLRSELSEFKRDSELTFEEVCKWSPRYAIEAMKANMLPQEEEAQTKK